MGTVTPLNAKSLTPEMVIDIIKENLDGVKDVYIVTNNIEGGFSLYASGDLEKLAEAALYLNHYATLKARDEIDTD